MTAATEITVQQIDGAFDAVTAGSLDFTWGATDLVNGNTFKCNGKEILMFRNDNVGAQTVTIDSVTDEFGREGDITAYSLAAGDYAVFPVGLTNAKGWKQTTGYINFTVSSTDIKVAILRLP